MATASGEAPITVTMRVPMAAVAAGSDLTSPIGRVPFAGTVTGVRYIPTSVLTGADTNSRTLNVYNRKSDNSGTTVVATKAYTAGQNIAANTAGTVPLSGTAANLDVAAGDVLDFESLHIGGTGLADPGGLVEVDVLKA